MPRPVGRPKSGTLKDYYVAASVWRKKYREEWHDKVLVIMGSRCCQCGYNADKRALQVDHIDGGGCRESAKTGLPYWKKVLESVDKNEGKYQLLCANCNFIKRYTHDELGGIKRKIKDKSLLSSDVK